MIWLLERRRQADYDQHDSMVVRAETIKEAREICAAEVRGRSCESETEWSDARNSTCKALCEEGPDRLILASFNAG